MCLLHMTIFPMSSQNVFSSLGFTINLRIYYYLTLNDPLKCEILLKVSDAGIP